MNSGNNVANDQMDPLMLFMKNDPHVLMLPLDSTVVTQVGITDKKIATYDAIENSKRPIFTVHI